MYDKFYTRPLSRLTRFCVFWSDSVERKRARTHTHPSHRHAMSIFCCLDSDHAATCTCMHACMHAAAAHSADTPHICVHKHGLAMPWAGSAFHEKIICMWIQLCIYTVRPSSIGMPITLAAADANTNALVRCALWVVFQCNVMMDAAADGLECSENINSMHALTTNNRQHIIWEHATEWNFRVDRWFNDFITSQL